jgi:hypothetical protein
MTESNEQPRADDEIAALRTKYEAVIWKKIAEATLNPLRRELEIQRWWKEADTSLRLLIAARREAPYSKRLVTT